MPYELRYTDLQLRPIQQAILARRAVWLATERYRPVCKCRPLLLRKRMAPRRQEYRQLSLSELERQYLHKRIADEQAELERWEMQDGLKIVLSMGREYPPLPKTLFAVSAAAFIVACVAGWAAIPTSQARVVEAATLELLGHLSPHPRSLSRARRFVGAFTERSRTRGHRTATGPIPVMISRAGRWPWRTNCRCHPRSAAKRWHAP